MESKKLENKKGITLIALVVTIVVLLILAGVTIAMLTGENGIINQAKNAQKENDKAQITEEFKMILMEYITEQEIKPDTEFEKFLNERGINNITKNEDEYLIEYKKYLFTVDANTKQILNQEVLRARLQIVSGDRGENGWFKSKVTIKAITIEQQNMVYEITGSQTKAETSIENNGTIEINADGISTINLYYVSKGNTEKEKVASIVIKKDSVAPVNFNIIVPNKFETGFTVEAATTDTISKNIMYEYYVNNELKATTNQTTYQVTNLQPKQQYQVYVIAKDEAGNEKKSNVVSVNLNFVYSTSVNATAYRGNIGKIYYIPITGFTSGSVWGTDIYTDDSNIATAAIHAGVIKEGEKKVVAIRILEGKNSYRASTRNGIKSSSYTAWDGSYEFVK